MLLRLIWAGLLLVSALGAQTFHLDPDYSCSCKNYTGYYEDANGTLGWEEALKLPFHPYERESINFGFTRSVYWFKIDVQSDLQSLNKQWWLTIAYPLLEQIDLYLVTENGALRKHSRMGSAEHHRLEEYPLRNFVTDLPLLPEQKQTLLIRVKTQSSMQVPITIAASDTLLGTLEKESLKIGLYYGIFLIIFLYNAVLFVYTKDSNYIRYILFLTFFILWQLSFDGIGREYLWQDSQWMIHQVSASLIAFTAFFALYFSRRFLTIDVYFPKTDLLIVGLKTLSFVLGIIALFVPYASVIVYITAMVSVVPVVLLATGIAVMRRGYRPARFYVAGWSSFLVGTIIFAFNKFDLIPSFYGVNHVQQIGSAVEMIFLSWALADRVHLLQREYINKLSHLNETLSASVQSALDSARAKDRLFVQQSRLAAMGEMIEQIAHQWRQPLNNLALINQDLYVRYKLGKCDEESFDRTHSQIDEHLQYLSKTIDDFRNYYKADKSEQPEDIAELVYETLRLSDAFLSYARIKTEVIVRTTHKINLAKSEMIQVLLNLFKNAHDAIKERHIAEGKITVIIEEDGKGIQISVEDNAGGIDPEIIDRIFDIYYTTKGSEAGTGLGLHMSKYIVEESFGGILSVQNVSSGARFIIHLPFERSNS